MVELWAEHLGDLEKTRQSMTIMADGLQRSMRPKSTGLHTVVYEILRRSLEQLSRLELFIKSDLVQLDLAAWTARNMLELEIWTKYVLLSDLHLERFVRDAAHDAIDIAGAIHILADKYSQCNPDPNIVARRQAGLDNVNQHAPQSHLPNNPGTYLKASAIAKEVGLELTYKHLSKIYSKLVHFTAWSVLAFPSQLSPHYIGNLMILSTHKSATVILNAFVDSVRTRQEMFLGYPQDVASRCLKTVPSCDKATEL